MDLRSDIHKDLRDPFNKKIEFLLKRNPITKNLNVGTIESSLWLMFFRKKKKGDISTSAIDESLQITESNETAYCSTDESFESPSPFSSSATAAAATETPFIPSYVSFSSQEPSHSP